MSDLSTVVTDIDARLSDGSRTTSRQAIQSTLVALRSLLKMEVAFVSRITDGRRIFEFLDTDGSFTPVVVGQSDPLESTYCARVLDGRIPGLIPDARQVPEVRDLPATTALPVGAHLSVPIRRPGGAPMGTLCCFSRRPDPELRTRDLDLLTVFAGLIAGHLDHLMQQDLRARLVGDRLDGVVLGGGPQIALQPIVDLSSRRTASFEALARFPALECGTKWGPDRWFQEATAAGRGPELEAAALGAALARLGAVPASMRLAVNVSARALCASEQVRELVAGEHAHRLVVELTEHDEVDDYDRLWRVLSMIRAAGGRIAVDDAGSGYAGLTHILRLRPEVLKLDRSLVQGIATDPSRQAMCIAMVGFTDRTGSALVAEGVEEPDDLEMLASLGVPMAQGYLLGRPRLVAAAMVGQRSA
jgi:EAL domain-containing protein (putative c-di-GMP-specific phosphodiesterase class I)